MAFGQRRKTMANSLMASGMTKTEVIAAMDKASLSPTLRAEQCTLADFARLSDVVFP